jgi:hypothetical protein
MKKSVLVACFSLCVVGALSAIGFVNGNGKVISEEREVKGFAGISVSNAAHVVVSEGKKYSCVVYLDSNLMPLFKTKVERGILVMGFKPGTSVHNFKKCEILITMPELKKVEASGASKVELEDKFSGKELSVNLSGASSFSADADYEILGVKESGASRVALKGKFGDIAVDLSGASRFACEGGALGLSGEVSGASTVNFEDCSIDDAELRVSGASSIKLGDVDKKIKANLSGASSLKYSGDPELEKNISGASSIERRD